MKDKSSIVFTGDIGFDRYMYGKWNDEELISDEILDFLKIEPDVIILTHSLLDHTDPDTLETLYRSSALKVT